MLRPPPSPTILVLLAALFASSCASAVSVSDVAPPAQAASNASELLRLRTRKGDVAVLSGGGARHVTVYDTRGIALRTAEIEALRATDPELFELLTTSTASRGAFLDATLREDDEGRASKP